MSKKAINKDIWINSYPILIWLMTEPLAGLVDSRIAGIIGIETLSSVGIGTTIYFVFTWIFVFEIRCKMVLLWSGKIQAGPK